MTSTTGGTGAAVDTCPAFQGCQANVPNGGTLTIYWRGMSGASFLRITLKSWGLVGCNLGNPDTARPTGYTGNGGNVPFNPLPDSGAFSFNSFSTGGYAFFADANPTSRPTFHDEKTFRVGCGFLNGIWPTEPEPIGPQESEVTVETDVTPVPLPENPDMTPPDVLPAP